MIQIGLLGMGTVGTGVVEMINARDLGISIKKILVRDIKKKRDVELEAGILVDDYQEIINDDDIDIIIEVTSDLEKSYEYITKAFKKGKSVVTANKAVVSKYFEELSALAEENQVGFLYEASVGGGIPVLTPLKDQLDLNNISEVQGILNGTCNYILTRMDKEGLDYDEVLKIAQELGYAEADPTADVEGHDTLRKLRILASLSLQGKVEEEDILLHGISSIKAVDIENIKNMNSTVKLIGEAKLLDDGFTAVVQPMIVGNDSYFSNVNMAFNSVAFKGDNVGELKFYGSGAGKLPTANAVLRDVLDIVENKYDKKNPLGTKALKNLNDTIEGSYYLRASGLENMKAIRNIAEEIISEDDNIAIITKSIKFKEIETLIEELKIDRKDYFLAKLF